MVIQVLKKGCAIELQAQPLATICCSWQSLPFATQEVVDEGRHIDDGHTAIPITVGVFETDASGVAAEQVVDKGGHVGDGHVAVAVNITLLHIDFYRSRQGYRDWL